MPEQPPDSSRRERTPFANLDSLLRRHEELTNFLADPSVLADLKRYQEYAKAFAELEPIVEHVTELRTLEFRNRLATPDRYDHGQDTSHYLQFSAQPDGRLALVG